MLAISRVLARFRFKMSDSLNSDHPLAAVEGWVAANAADLKQYLETDPVVPVSMCG